MAEVCGPKPTILMWYLLMASCSVTWSSSVGQLSPVKANRSTNDVLESIEQKLGFILNSQSGLHQLQYAVTQMARRLDTIELRMARLEHKLDTKQNGLTSAAHEIAAKMALLEAQAGVQALNLASKLDRVESNVLTVIDERMSNVDKMLANASIVDNYTSEQVDMDVSTPIDPVAALCNVSETNPAAMVPVATTASHQTSTHEEQVRSYWLQMSNMSNHMVMVGEKSLRDLDSDIEIYTRKMMNTYHEVMKESRSIDVTLRQLQEQGNQTRLTVREAFRKLYHHTKPVSSLDDILRSLTKKVTEMANTVDTSFKSLLVAQNTFIATCDRVQQQEPVIETRIYQLLFKIVDELNNKSKTSKEECILREAFDSHKNEVGRALNDLLWTVISVGNQTVESLRKEAICEPQPSEPLDLPLFDSQLIVEQMDNNSDDLPSSDNETSTREQSEENDHQLRMANASEQETVEQHTGNEWLSPVNVTSHELEFRVQKSNGGTDVQPESLSLEEYDIDYDHELLNTGMVNNTPNMNLNNTNPTKNNTNTSNRNSNTNSNTSSNNNSSPKGLGN